MIDEAQEYDEVAERERALETLADRVRCDVHGWWHDRGVVCAACADLIFSGLFTRDVQ